MKPGTQCVALAAVVMALLYIGSHNPLHALLASVSLVVVCVGVMIERGPQ